MRRLALQRAARADGRRRAVDHPHQRRRRAAVCPADGATAAGVRRPLQPQRGDDADARRAVGAGADADQQHRPAQPHAERRRAAPFARHHSDAAFGHAETGARSSAAACRKRSGWCGRPSAGTPQDAPFDGAHARFPVPQVQMEWDEATCGQMVYLYNETCELRRPHRRLFAAMARPDHAGAG